MGAGGREEKANEEEANQEEANEEETGEEESTEGRRGEGGAAISKVQKGQGARGGPGGCC